MDESITGMKENVSSHERKRIHSSGKTQESSSKNLRRWEDLNLDILRKIFDGVSAFQLSRNVSSVCRSWQLGCWYKFFWGENKFDLRYIGPALRIVETIGSNRFIDHQEQNDKAVAMKLMKLLNSIMEGYDGYGFPLEQWRLSIRILAIPNHIRILDPHLIFLAERTAGLENLLLFGSTKLTGTGFAKATRNWKNVKSIHLGHIKSQYVSEVIEEIGKNCTSLELLCLCIQGLHLRQEIASVIIRSLQQVKKLRFCETYLHRDGVNYIFSNPFWKVEIQFHDCYLLDDQPPKPGQPVCHDLRRRNFTLRRKEGHGDFCFADITQYFESFLQRWMNPETD